MLKSVNITQKTFLSHGSYFIVGQRVLRQLAKSTNINAMCIFVLEYVLKVSHTKKLTCLNFPDYLLLC